MTTWSRTPRHSILDLYGLRRVAKATRAICCRRFRGAALLRMCDTVDSIMALMSRRKLGDARALLRSLYEQVVVFCWVAVDPATRLERWEGASKKEQLKLHNEALRYGEWILTSDEAEEFAAAPGSLDSAALQLASPRAESRSWGDKRGFDLRRSRTLPPFVGALEAPTLGKPYWLWRSTRRQSTRLESASRCFAGRHACDPLWLPRERRGAQEQRP